MRVPDAELGRSGTKTSGRAVERSHTSLLHKDDDEERIGVELREHVPRCHVWESWVWVGVTVECDLHSRIHYVGGVGLQIVCYHHACTSRC